MSIEHDSSPRLYSSGNQSTGIPNVIGNVMSPISVLRYNPMYMHRTRVDPLRQGGSDQGVFARTLFIGPFIERSCFSEKKIQHA